MVLMFLSLLCAVGLILKSSVWIDPTHSEFLHGMTNKNKCGLGLQRHCYPSEKYRIFTVS